MLNPALTATQRGQGLLQAAQASVESPPPAAEDTPRPSQALAGGDSSPVYRHFEEMAWSNSVVTWLIAATGIILLLAALIWAGAAVIWFKPIGMIRTPPALRDLVKEGAKTSFVPNRDPLEFFVSGVLTSKSYIRPDGSCPGLDALQGLVAPDVLERFETSVQRNATAVKASHMTQTLNIDSFGEIVENPEDRRIAVFVQGQISVTQKVGPKGPSFRTLEYRARVVVEINTPTQVNHQHFYLVSLEERVGPAALEWAKQQGATR